MRSAFANMGKTLFAFLLLLAGVTGRAQIQDPFTEAVQTHVDHIEEFIERFNFKEGSRFRQYTDATYPEYNVDRAVVVNALFNKRLKKTDQAIRQRFVEAVINPSRPAYLEVYDALWYATVPVSMRIEGEYVELEVTLEVQLNRDYSIEWTVIGMSSEIFENLKPDKDLYISVSSHATFFPELREGLSSTNHFQNIVSDSQKASNTQKFINLIDDKEVSDIKILNGISYHFLQISGWIMVVEYAPQDYSLNTGWLISEVIPVDSFLKKRMYQREQLGIMSNE